ncbi:hypothetical protein HYALB_00009493 [Hymenoscyphus albidus]|uniref:Uncharacterized protein n=1 Tax=Hymenoscyphus albidus TaxID=595503 RepID=A0A9N9QB04_9HELO|nr:hypothetical protein HYALB_00009493 [Hymenoscyphus albidus]
MTSASPLSPTFHGHIASTQDALLLFEACLSGALNHVARRPHDRERSSLIRSGNVFIYEEHSSGIKRWTDGVPWSPSRILGNFLVYRELERPFPPGEKKRAMKRSKRSPGISKTQEPFGPAVNSNYAVATTTSSYLDSTSSSSLSKETERSLIGSLVDSYGFKEEGLVKKTVSVTVGGVSHHLVSYYTVADVMNNKLNTPSKDHRFSHIIPRSDLITKQNFRTPIDEVDSMDRIEDRAAYSAYPYVRNGYEMTNQSISNRAMSLPTPPIPYPSSSMYGSYGMGSSGIYDGLPSSHSAASSYNGQFAPSPGIYTGPPKSEYDMGAYRPRYNSVVPGMNSESSRDQITPVSTQFQRRSSIYDQTSSTDSGLSGISTTSADSKVSNDSGYASQGFYGSYREGGHAPQNFPLQPARSLPTPHQHPSFDRPAHAYSGVESPSLKENIWPMGNASAGHGHYMAPQQQWASTGSS